jgi:hypothetical protein
MKGDCGCRFGENSAPHALASSQMVETLLLGEE